MRNRTEDYEQFYVLTNECFKRESTTVQVIDINNYYLIHKGVLIGLYTIYAYGSTKSIIYNKRERGRVSYSIYHCANVLWIIKAVHLCKL